MKEAPARRRVPTVIIAQPAGVDVSKIVQAIKDENWEPIVVRNVDELFDHVWNPRVHTVFIGEKFHVDTLLLIRKSRAVSNAFWILITHKLTKDLNMKAINAGVAAILAEPVKTVQYMLRARQMLVKFNRERNREREQRAARLAKGGGGGGGGPVQDVQDRMLEGKPMVVLTAGNGRRNAEVMKKLTEEEWSIKWVKTPQEFLEWTAKQECFCVFAGDKFHRDTLALIKGASKNTKAFWLLIVAKFSQEVHYKAAASGISVVLSEPVNPVQYLIRARQMFGRWKLRLEGKEVNDEGLEVVQGAEGAGESIDLTGSDNFDEDMKALFNEGDSGGGEGGGFDLTGGDDNGPAIRHHDTSADAAGPGINHHSSSDDPAAPGGSFYVSDDERNVASEGGVNATGAAGGAAVGGSRADLRNNIAEIREALREAERNTPRSQADIALEEAQKAISEIRGDVTWAGRADWDASKLPPGAPGARPVDANSKESRGLNESNAEVRELFQYVCDKLQAVRLTFISLRNIVPPGAKRYLPETAFVLVSNDPRFDCNTPIKTAFFPIVRLAYDARKPLYMSSGGPLSIDGEARDKAWLYEGNPEQALAVYPILLGNEIYAMVLVQFPRPAEEGQLRALEEAFGFLAAPTDHYRKIDFLSRFYRGHGIGMQVDVSKATLKTGT